ncbi:platelet endothelial aggregation receptor 1 isoform X3 [Heterocephalus glaber]|uniref:Platelet endothelial aggregation receptor 1 isoform X3 n=1 Tax=Heterocephalus glaber TaxID=10181 RepID=A0AAX6QEC0_HETGA|nr:platelet endothelial aggregation receptor 1 isoform X3 [Heterocephalus glaber]
MAPPANSNASATGHPVTPRLELASVPQGGRGPAVMCPVPRALLASCALPPTLAKMGVSSRPARAPAAVLLAGWALFAPCPAQRASMDPTAPRNVAATTVASVTDSLGSAAVPPATQAIGAARSARWAASGRTVTGRVTVPRVRAASPPTARVCANTASLGTAAPSASVPTASTASAARRTAPAIRSTASAATRCTASARAGRAGRACTATRAARRTRTARAARNIACACTAASAWQTAASAGAGPATRGPTAPARVPPTHTGSIAPGAARAKTPSPARPSTALASARRVGSVVTALCPAHPEPGASVAMPVASVPTKESAAPKLEPVPAPLGGMGPTASYPARRGSLVKVVLLAVTVTTLMAVTLFMDTASARPAGQAPTATCPALRASGESTAATPAPARMGAPASPRMATVCVHLASGVPPARDVRLPAPTPSQQQQACQPGRYGKRCMPCKCNNHSSCHPVDGTCYCLAGWTGPDCSQPCPSGQWGANCAQPCQCHHGGTCHPQDGSCICTPGWTGQHCLEGCPPGMFGANCSQPCQCGPGEKCHPESGGCVCPPGYSGAPCMIGSQEPFTMTPTSPVAYNSLGAVIGIAVLGSLVVALIALFIGYRHWQKGKEHQHLAVAYSSGRLDGSEYVMPDVPPSYSHYYSNPSYHTLSQCSPSPPPPNKVPGSPLFASLQAPERPGGAHRHDNLATLPADWKHRQERPPGGSQLDRSYSYSYRHGNGPGPISNKGNVSEEGLGASLASLSSENPYATIRDLPSLPGGPRESSYVEMKGPPSASPPRQCQRRDSQQRWQPQPQRDSGTYEQPSPLTHDRDSVASQPPLPPGLPPGHYDSPKNSHIPGHYDLPPVRHPPSPPLRHQDR